MIILIWAHGCNQLMYIIDLHSHLNLLPFPIPFIMEKFFSHRLKLQDYINLSKKLSRKIIISPALYNVPGIHFGISGLRRQIDFLKKEIRQTEGEVKIIYDQKDLKSDFEVGLVLQLESCRWIPENNIDKTILELKSLGIRGVIPIHFKDNWLGKACDMPPFPTNSKTDYGLNQTNAYKFFKSCKENKLWIDLSHMSYKSIADSYDLDHHTICMTHTSVQDVFDTPRAMCLRDIKEIHKRKGFVGLCPAKRFTPKTKNYWEMIQYFIDLGYEDTLGIGTDYGSLIKTDKGLEDYEKLFMSIEKISLDSEVKEKILWKNAYRFLEKTL